MNTIAMVVGYAVIASWLFLVGLVVVSWIKIGRDLKQERSRAIEEILNER